jgi:hypothetical protein
MVLTIASACNSMNASVNFHLIKKETKIKRKKAVSLTLINLGAVSSLFGQGFPCLQKKRFAAFIYAVY